MLAAILLILLIFIIVIAFILKGNQSTIISNSSHDRPLKPNEESNIVESNKPLNNDGIDYSIYRDNYIGENSEYIDWTPEEARAELRRAKEDGDWLDDDKYYGLLDVITSGKDEKYLSRVESMTPEQTAQWFNKQIEKGVKMSSAIWQAVGEKVAPIHEDFLLNKLDSVTKGKVDGWVHARKKEGYFFTQRVYDKALAIRKGEIDNRKTKDKKKSN